MTSTAYCIDTDENVAITGMQKLECHQNVEISLGMLQRRWWGERTLPSKDKNIYKGETEVEFYHNDLKNIQQLARIKPALTVVGTRFNKTNCNQRSPHLKDKDVYKGDTEVKFYHNDLKNIQQLARIKPAFTVVWYSIH